MHFTKSDFQSSSDVPSSYTFTSGDGGVHAFSSSGTHHLTFTTAGSETVSATETATASVSITGTIAAMAVSPGAAASLAVNIAPGRHQCATVISFAPTVTGGTFTLAFGTSAPITVAYSIVPSILEANIQNALNSLSTVGTSSGGTNALVSAASAGNYLVTFQNAMAGTSQSNLIVNGAALTGIDPSVSVATEVAGGSPNSAAPGVPFPISVRALDAYGNLATGYTGTVYFTSTDFSASCRRALQADWRGGRASAPRYTPSRSQTISATDTFPEQHFPPPGAAAASQSRETRSITSASPALPRSLPARWQHILSRLKDSSNATATGYAGTVEMQITNGQAILPCDYRVSLSARASAPSMPFCWAS